MSETTDPNVEPDAPPAEAEQTDASEAAGQEAELPSPEVTLTELDPCRRNIHLLATAEAIQAHRDAKYKEIGTKAQVPGFRPGRAPRRLLVKRFGEDIDNEIKRELIVAGFEKAVEDNDLQIVGQPKMDIEELTLPAEGPMEFDIEVEVRPTFELPAYKGVPVTRPDTVVTDEEIAEQLERLRKQIALRQNAFEPVEKGTVRSEDMLLADVTGTLAEGGEAFYSETDRAMIVGPGMLLVHPTREEVENLTGAKVGETRAVSGHVGPRHETVELRGKDASFAITVKEIKRLVLPEADDKLAEAVGFESLEELRGRMRESAEAEKKEHATEATRNQLRDWLVEHTALELPKALTERQKAGTLQRQKIRLLRQGVPEQVIQEREAELQKASDERVERDLKLNFIIQRIADAEELSVEDDEINGIVSAIAAQTNRRFTRLREEMADDGRLDLLHADVLERHVLDHLIEQADYSATAAPDAGEKTAGNKDQEETP
jgi:trigger factor